MVPGQPENIPNVHILYLELNQSPLCVLHIALTDKCVVHTSKEWPTGSEEAAGAPALLSSLF